METVPHWHDFRKCLLSIRSRRQAKGFVIAYFVPRRVLKVHRAIVYSPLLNRMKVRLGQRLLRRYAQNAWNQYNNAANEAWHLQTTNSTYRSQNLEYLCIGIVKLVERPVKKEWL